MSEYRFTASHVTQAVLNADASSVVANWTINRPGERWNVGTSGLIAPGTSQRVTLSNNVALLGRFALPVWSFGVVSLTQAAYLYNTQFGGVYTTDATIKTFNALRNQFEIYQTHATIQVGESVNINDAWFAPLTVSFLPGVIAPVS